MQTPSLTKNAILNSVKTISALLFPLITFPYASRVLGVANLGKVNYSSSIVSYFALIAALGLSNYAIREGARIRDDKERLSRFACRIFTVNLVTCLIAYLLLLITVLLWRGVHSYALLIAIQSISMVSTALGVEWLYSIFEDYLYISLRSISVQFLSLLLLFSFVHKPSDYVIYAGISVFASSAVNLWGFIHAHTYCDIKPVRNIPWRSILGPSFALFSNNVAIAIYGNAGTTLVGIFAGDIQVGLYSVAMKIYNMTRQVINSLTIVALPRLSYLLGTENHARYYALLNRVIDSVIVASVPITGFLFVLSRPVILLLAGEQYIDSVLLLRIVCVAILLSLPSALITGGVLIPFRQEKTVVISTVSGAVVNIAIDVLGIPLAGAQVAAISIVISELVVFLLCVVFARQQMKHVHCGRAIFHALIGIVPMLVLSVVLCKWLQDMRYWWCILLFVVISSVAYGAILLLFKDSTAVFYAEKAKRRFGR